MDTALKNQNIHSLPLLMTTRENKSLEGITPAPALPHWRSRAPDSPALRTPQHYALLPPSLRTPVFPRISDYWTQSPLSLPPLYLSVPRSVPCLNIDCHMSLFTRVLTLFLSCSMSVPIKCLTPRTSFSTPLSVLTEGAAAARKRHGAK